MSIFRGQDIHTKVGEDISRPNYIHYTKVDMLWSSYIQQSWCRYFEPKLYTPRLVSIFQSQAIYTKIWVFIFNSKLCIPMLMSIFRGQAIYTKVGVDISSPSYVHQGWCRYFKAKLYTLRFRCLYFNGKLCIPMLMSIFRGQAIYTKVGVDISRPSYIHQGWCRYFEPKLCTPRLVSIFQGQAIYTKI